VSVLSEAPGLFVSYVSEKQIVSLCQEVASLSVPSWHQVQDWLKEMAGLSGRINDKFSLRGSASLGNGNAGVSASVGWRLK